MKTALGYALALTGLALLAYFPTLRSGFIWDDDAYVLSNLALRNLGGLRDIWFHPGRLVQYYPLTFTSLWIDYQFWGLNAAGYHLMNVLLHTLNAFVVWRLLEHLKIRSAWFISLLFLLHPVQVESVAWITERKNVLSGFFYFSTLLVYLRFKEKRAGSWSYLTAYLLFLGALLSKTVTATLPVTALLILWWKKGRFSWFDAVQLVPFFVTAVLLGSVTVGLENQHVFFVGLDQWNFSIPDRILIAGRALWFYLGKLIWPHPLIFIYPRWEIDSSQLWQWLYPVSFLGLIAILWIFRSRIGRGLFLAFAVFGVTLLPALGLKNFLPMRFSFVADHFQYLAMIAPLAYAVSCGFSALEKHARIRMGIGITVLIVFGALSWKQSQSYKSAEILWRDTLSKNPNSWVAHINLGAELIQFGQTEEAEFHFKEGLRLKSDLAEGHNNLAGLMLGQGRQKEAVHHYEEAVRYRPNSATFHNNLAAVLLADGKIEEAMDHLRQANELETRGANIRPLVPKIGLKKARRNLAWRTFTPVLIH